MGTPLGTVPSWQVTLRAGAKLDAHRVNQYTLVLRAACPGEEEVTGWLFVWVTAGQVLRCDAPFASAVGDVVRVPADVAPHAPLHAVLLQPLGGLTVSACSPLSRPLPAGATPGDGCVLSPCSSGSELRARRSRSPHGAWCWHPPAASAPAGTPRWAPASPCCHSTATSLAGTAHSSWHPPPMPQERFSPVPIPVPIPSSIPFGIPSPSVPLFALLS